MISLVYTTPCEKKATGSQFRGAPDPLNTLHLQTGIKSPIYLEVLPSQKRLISPLYLDTQTLLCAVYNLPFFLSVPILQPVV